MLPDPSGNGLDVLQIGGAIFTGGGAHRDKDAVAAAQGKGEVGGKDQAFVLGVTLQQGFDAGLIDRSNAGFQLVDLVGIGIYPDDVVTDLGKAHARDQTHVTRTNHGYPHKAPPLSPNEELL